MRTPPQWYQISTARLSHERAVLAALPYFALERTYYNDAARFTAVGILRYIGARSGRTHTMRIRLEFPDTFPKRAPRVFDHDQIFKPGADGHLLGSHELCTTLTERGEFSLGTDGLTEEVLSAALVWFHKRKLSIGSDAARYASGLDSG